jgi:protein involved in polysaccharide export with SLBB domain
MTKRLFLFLGMLLITAMTYGQMSDDQVLNFIAAETKAGTSQSQIVTKLVQRGVNIEQVRRLRNQYDKQISEKGLSKAADGAVSMATERMQGNSDGTTSQELTTAKRGTSGEVYSNASEEVKDVEHDVQATQNVAPTASGKRVFGRDIFSQANPSFQPNVNMAVPPTYILGPGDQVVIDIYGASQQTLIHTISPEGTITIPSYGPVYLSGLSVAAAKKKLKSTVGSRYQSSNLQVSVANTRTIQVNIMGEVRVPGTYRLSAFANVFYALYRAGGTSSLGTLRNIKVYRDEEVVAVIDLYDYILNGRMTGNVNLQDNDIIQVGVYDRLVGITGSVRRPMFYEMREGESLATLIEYAGDFTGDANRKTVRLVRQNGERYQVFNVDEADLKNFLLEDGDAVTVDGMINRFQNMVEIKGAVFRPGLFRLDSNLTTVRGLIEAADGLTEDAFTTRAVLHRLQEDRSLLTIPVDIQGIMDGKVADITLMNEDVLFIPTEKDLRVERTFSITGEVMSPGTYEYADNTTIEDLIVMAGGLTDRASTAKVDVSRRIMDPQSTQKTNKIAESYTFSLKDGLVIEGESGFVLKPYDVVHVRRSPAYSTARNISVTGEVNYEGSFTMESKEMRLSDAISMAGGLTPDAYLKGARLTRQLTDEERIRHQASMAAIREILVDRGDSIVWAKIQQSNSYYVGIDLAGAMKKPGSDKDILLREGDQIFVPEYNGVVKISGDVMFPNTVFFDGKKGVNKYIEEAGGYGNRAKKSKTFIVYQNGTVGLTSKGAKPEPGCEIIVPAKKKRQSTFDVAALTATLTSVASLSTVAVSLTSLIVTLKK